jgi:prepilin-type N-terminal cleavage/methylation domain-containing protein
MLHKKGFTLIELIIVIALIALLATTVILVINPVKIFQEARDSQRIADLGQMNSAMSLMLATSSSQPTLGVVGTCYKNKATQNCMTRHTPNLTVSSTIATQTVDGTGWVPVSLGTSPAITAWPLDPTNNGTFFYSYTPDSANQWEFTAAMESVRYGTSTSADNVVSTDGGNQSTLFEVGTNVNL